MIENIKNYVWRLSHRSETRFGIIALTLLVAAALIAGMTVVLRPG